MNLTIGESSLYLHKLDKELVDHRNVEMVLAPSFLALSTLAAQIDRGKFKLAAQNFYWQDEGAYTGEVSIHQLRGLVRYALVGHSERRNIFRENDKEIRAKVQAAVRHRIIPVLCIGETASEKASGETVAVLHDQLVGGLANLTSDEVETMVIAYEPVWAISKGKDFKDHAIPTPELVADVVKAIRRQVAHLYGKAVADKVRVIYGGSINGANAASFLAVKDLDGLLPGGASLHFNEYKAIIEAAFERGDR